MAISTNDRNALYVATFDAFVRGRNIDEDDEYWSDADREAWEERLVFLRSQGVLQ